MKKLVTYMPVFVFIMVIIFIENLLAKVFLGISLIFLMVISKYTRNKMNQEEIEFDDRVNANITKWSLRFMFFSNLLLTFILILIN